MREFQELVIFWGTCPSEYSWEDEVLEGYHLWCESEGGPPWSDDSTPGIFRCHYCEQFAVAPPPLAQRVSN